jgi:hypothetical protein
MRLVQGFVCAVAIALVVPAGLTAQDADRKVAGGGITVAGWKGKVDSPSKQGLTINDSKFSMQGPDLRFVIGPPAIYWNPAHTAKGDFTVKGTFKDVISDAGHPHSAGVFIGGTNLDTDEQNYTYCVAYTDGAFMIRQFTGLKVATLSRKAPHAAVKSGATGATNEIGWTVKGGRAECVINGQVVAGFDKGQTVGAVTFQPTDGIYGIRVTHNMNLTVAGFGLVK